MGHLVISMIMTTVMHTVDGCLYVECVCMSVHVCLKKNQNAPRCYIESGRAFTTELTRSMWRVFLAVVAVVGGRWSHRCT